jgi:hypothetical protein
MDDDMILTRAGFAMLAITAGTAADQANASPADMFSVGNAIPPRLQWNENWGYCGEVSLISAGLYYGQYISQYEARALASPGIPQSQYNSQLLIGVNDQVAAAAMHLNAVEWNRQKQKNTNQFLAWVTRYVSAGYPVAIGVFVNEFLFYGNTDPQAGSTTYDHVVPVTGISSQYALPNRQYHPTDIIAFNDNGEWNNDGAPPYLFSYEFASFKNDRAGANAPDAAIYSLPDGGQNYGVAITGVMDRNHDTVPVQVATSVNDEEPEIVNGSNDPPPPFAMTLTITVSGLTPGVNYNLYRYTSFGAVPDDHFNRNAGNASESWPINIGAGTTATITENIMSDELAIYRAVPATAP